jgi:predicted RNA binding protein YcfA (HicA-like mRNA interferase family)
MPPYGPTKRRDLIATLRKLGFTGPYPGGKHQRMERGDQNVPVPNPHEGDLSVGGLARLLKLIGVTRDEWERL